MHPWTHRYGPERFSTCAEVSVDAIAINAAAAKNPTLIAYSRGSLLQIRRYILDSGHDQTTFKFSRLF
jgi:hypothetical protein